MRSIGSNLILTLVFTSVLGCKVTPGADTPAPNNVTPPQTSTASPVPASTLVLNTTATRANGGSDSSGGNYPTPTAKEVVAAISMALKISTNDDVRRNLFRRFAVEASQKESDDKVAYVMPIDILFPRLRNLNDKTLVWIDKNIEAKLESPIIEALKRIKISDVDLKMDGPCDAQDNDHADASVSSRSLNARLCFSVFNLMKTPKAGLLELVNELLIHEATHMGGGNEAEAQEIQKVFSQYYAEYFGYAELSNLAAKHLETILKLVASELSIDIYIQTHEETRAFALLMVLASQLSSMPKLFDPLYMDLGFAAARPDLQNNYVNAVIDFSVKSWTYMHIADTLTGPQPLEGLSPEDAEDERQLQEMQGLEPRKALPPLPTGDELKKIAKDLTKSMSVIINNYAAYAKNEGISECVLPQGRVSRFLTFGVTPNPLISAGIAARAPPRVCDPGTAPPGPRP